MRGQKNSAHRWVPPLEALSECGYVQLPPPNFGQTENESPSLPLLLNWSENVADSC